MINTAISARECIDGIWQVLESYRSQYEEYFPGMPIEEPAQKLIRLRTEATLADAILSLKEEVL